MFCFVFLDNVVKTKSMDVNRILFSKLSHRFFVLFFKAIRRTLVKQNSSVLNNLKKKSACSLKSFRAGGQGQLPGRRGSDWVI